MHVIDSYLEKAWGESVDKPTIDDVKSAIIETKQMDEEHGAFWVGVFGENDEEIVLEVDKNLKTTLLQNPDSYEEITKLAESWDKVIESYMNLLNGEIEQIKDWMDS